MGVIYDALNPKQESEEFYTKKMFIDLERRTILCKVG